MAFRYVSNDAVIFASINRCRGEYQQQQYLQRAARVVHGITKVQVIQRDHLKQTITFSIGTVTSALSTEECGELGKKFCKELIENFRSANPVPRLYQSHR